MPLPARMTAVAITKPGGPEVLVPEERPLPSPGASDLPGLEVSGEVVATGKDAKRFKVGDKVLSLVAGGGYAEYCVADDAVALPVPKGFSMIEAAAIPETFMTVWHNVFQRGALKSGETLLVHGGSSGIGTTAIMLAKAFGAKVIVTAGDDAKCDACKKLGADVAINYKTQDFVEEAKKATNGKGVELILDMVGGDYVDRNYDAAAVEGRIVQIATQKGFKVTTNLLKIMQKRLTHTGSTLRPRSTADKSMIAHDLEAKAWPFLAGGRIKPVIDSTFALKEAAKAHARMDTSAHIGKIVLTVGG
jgi:putative PIG3 family NAD(P)H quinone oxidoreductase